MKIILLAGKGISTNFMYNGLKGHFPISNVIIEDGRPKIEIVKRRIKRLGYFRVINQLLFQMVLSKLLSYASRKRVQEIITNNKLLLNPIPADITHKVSSVNSRKCIQKIKTLKPDVIIVNGTGIISKKVLGSVKSLFINSHVGITPQYRGVHGAYWALIANDAGNCGVTIHIVDKGVDTGKVIEQDIIFPTKKDNFVTYPYLQFSLAIRLMLIVLSRIKYSELNAYKKSNAKSKLYYHPTFTGYLYNWFFRGVK